MNCQQVNRANVINMPRPRANIPYREFVRMWHDDSIDRHYMAKYFKVADQTIKLFAKRCKLGKKNEKREVLMGGLP